MTVDELQSGFMSDRVIIDTVFILRRLPEEYHAKRKTSYMCFVDSESF